MANVLHKASELPPDVQQAVSRLLGHALNPEDRVSIRTYRAHQAPTGEKRAELVARIERGMDKISANLQSVPGEELEEIIDEAVDHARHRR